jgi:hypothetical protein
MAKRFWIYWKRYDIQSDWIYYRQAEYCDYKDAVSAAKWDALKRLW